MALPVVSGYATQGFAPIYSAPASRAAYRQPVWETLPLANGAVKNGHANGNATGRANGYANGSANGYANGYANGHANGHANGTETEEAQARRDLSVAHKISNKFGCDELIQNHISARLSDGRVLITPGDKLWDEIEPCDLVEQSKNVTADVIHHAVYTARPDVNAIVHWHSPHATAVSCLEGGFRCLAQESSYFYKKVANYTYAGISEDEEEAPLIAATVTGDYNTLLMQNHGFCTFGATVAEAWVLAWYFERSCATQLKVMQSGGKVIEVSDEQWAAAQKTQMSPGFFPGESEWPALCRLADRL